MHVVAVGGPIDAGTERGEKRRGERTWVDAGEERRGGGGEGNVSIPCYQH